MTGYVCRRADVQKRTRHNTSWVLPCMGGRGMVPGGIIMPWPGPGAICTPGGGGPRPAIEVMEDELDVWPAELAQGGLLAADRDGNKNADTERISLSSIMTTVLHKHVHVHRILVLMSILYGIKNNYCISRERCRLHGQSETFACSSYFSVLPGKLLPAEYTICACLLVIRNFSCYELVRNFIALNGN